MSSGRSVSADKTGEMINMSVGHKVNAGRQNRGKAEYVCRAQGLSADKTEEKPNMSARRKVCRQTKQRKNQICLPGARFVGRQNRGKTEYVCQAQGSSADKIEEIQEMSAGCKVCQQTNTRKT